MTDRPEAADSLIASLTALARTLLGLITETAHLAALEARLAGLSLAVMVAAGIALGITGVSVWLALVAAGAVLLVRLGLAWEAALLLVALFNLALALGLLKAIVVLSRNLTFRATRRQLLPGSPAPTGNPSHADSRTQASAPPGSGPR